MVKGTANSFGLALPRGAGWQKFPRFWNIFNRLPDQLRAPQAAVKRIPEPFRARRMAVTSMRF
jgi:hypothetical protein